MPTRHGDILRTADVARRCGYSVEQVRKLERAGVLPPARRTPAGYRCYEQRHVDCALAYRALAAGAGPVEAARIVRAAHSGPAAELLAMVDAAHARLDTQRRDLAAARTAAAAIDAEPIDAVHSSDAMTVSELAGALGVRASTLRHWDAAGLVRPGRAAPSDARRYSPADVRDARIVHQLRQAGHRIDALRALLPGLRGTGCWRDVLAGLEARQDDIHRRSLALLGAGAHLAAVLAASDPGPRPVPPSPTPPR